MNDFWSERNLRRIRTRVQTAQHEAFCNPFIAFSIIETHYTVPAEEPMNLN